jgi:hypothetical protein
MSVADVGTFSETQVAAVYKRRARYTRSCRMEGGRVEDVCAEWKLIR